jgi:hypothetical protein
MSPRLSANCAVVSPSISYDGERLFRPIRQIKSFVTAKFAKNIPWGSRRNLAEKRSASLSALSDLFFASLAVKRFSDRSKAMLASTPEPNVVPLPTHSPQTRPCTGHDPRRVVSHGFRRRSGQ